MRFEEGAGNVSFVVFTNLSGVRYLELRADTFAELVVSSISGLFLVQYERSPSIVLAFL